MVNAALRVSAQSGFADAKVDQIATAADLFRSKESLLDALLERYALLPELPEMMAALGDTPPALGIPTLIAEIWRLLQQREELAHVISREIQSSAESGKVFAEQPCPSSYQPLAAYLDRWMKRGALRPKNALAAARCMIGMLWFFLLTKEVIAGEDLYALSDETVVTTVVRIFLYAPAKAKHSLSHTAAGGGRRHGS
jgi:AcrR family transcriptional regulator